MTTYYSVWIDGYCVSLSYSGRELPEEELDNMAHNIAYSVAIGQNSVGTYLAGFTVTGLEEVGIKER